MWDFQWRKQCRTFKGLKTQIRRILKIDDEKTLLNAIQNDEVFKFISCDVTTPIYLIKNFSQAGFVFPPVISK